MSETSFLADHVTSIQKFLTTFSTLTNIRLFFYSTNQKIVDKQHILIRSQDVFNYLAKIDFPQLTLFPTVLDNSLSGFFILDVDTSSKERAIMYQSYLESICQRFETKESDSHMVVLNAVDTHHLQRCMSGLELINHIQPAPVVRTNPQPARYYGKESHDVNNNLRKALHYINENLSRPLTLEDVAQRIYLSPSYLSRLFKKDFNVNFIDYINLQKVALAEKKMLAGPISINKLAKQLGFSQASYFTKIFKKKCGLTPSKYRIKSSNFKKVYTISRDLSWCKNQSVYDASKVYFATHHIKFQYQTLNGYPFIYAIGDLGSESKTDGWIYTVDYRQPVAPPSSVTVGDVSVIQWIYTKVIF